MNIFTLHILFLGIACFQAFFILVQWFFFRRKEYLFYIAYIVSIIVFILFRINEAQQPPFVQMPVWLQRLTYQPLGIFSYWMYLCFGRSFLNLERTQPAVYKYVKRLEYMFIVFIVCCIMLIPFEIDKAHLAVIYFAGYIPLLLMCIPAFVLMLKQRDILNNFLVIGCLFYVAGGFTGMMLNYTINKFDNSNTVVFLGVEIGILMELLLLNTGFILKNRILQQQVIKGQQKILEEFMSKKKDTGTNN